MILYLGDIHGDFNVIKSLLARNNITNATIIQVGDFGVGFNRFEHDLERLTSLNHALIEANVMLYAIRGNHDYKPYFDNDPFNLSNVKLLKDYTTMNIDGFNILFIGGAVSVDRELAKTDMQKLGDYTVNIGTDRWFHDEGLVFDLEALENLNDIDIVVTHIAPLESYPLNNVRDNAFLHRYIIKDHMLIDDLNKERKILSDIFNILKDNGNKIKEHYYGHYHNSNIDIVNNIKHRLLNINELY